ncbi:MAG TPA: OB-fold nucleic acid binding domain-containing protein [archaeon]|nr:OB-fold nucleic acid binding domain-containing protein [archaeon]
MTAIKELKDGMTDVTVKAKVTDKSETREVYSRYGFNVHRVANATISDGTGSIKLVLWNDQIREVAVGNDIEIENGYVKTFRGELQLSVGRKNGKLIVLNKKK